MCSVKLDPVYNQPDLQSQCLSIWWVGNETKKQLFYKLDLLNELKHLLNAWYKIKLTHFSLPVTNL